MRVVTILTAVAFGCWGISAWVSWLTTPDPLTYHQAYLDGFANGLSDRPSILQWNGMSHYNATHPPWGSHSCVTDWDGQYTGDSGGAGFSNGGPTPTRLITYADQNTHTRLGNAWMRGCRAALMDEGY